ncbi:hypothetical protein [Tepidibacter aestuarii]|uniref:hypothetical protein n=1 Tax=Tepidibacter aestuarii TaxID=2925782 RepID=UPI0020BFE442|nr:hypothetical protein [Tepidibacter aestuarii]CAH2211989.1 conserved protein of unknown function [Tepidibacter aestuarii]
MGFLFAKITNSRLMGTMGLRTALKIDNDRLDQYFLLDAEKVGIADYVSIKNGNERSLYEEEERLMGGLGSDRISINEKEAMYLINHFGNKNLEYNKELPGCKEEYIDIIKNEADNVDYESLFLKISKKIETPIEFINYMTMRIIGSDYEALNFFSNYYIDDMNITDNEAVLLKNKVVPMKNNRYISEFIFEDDIYYKSKIGFNISHLNGYYKIDSIIYTDKEKVDFNIVSNELRKKEYISIYNVENIFCEKFIYDNPGFMKSEFECGILLTEFKSNNKHVNKDIYYISGDINAMYYINDTQLVVATYDYYTEAKVEKILIEEYSEYIGLNSKYEFENSLIYEFAQIGYDDFYDFIEDDI